MSMKIDECKECVRTSDSKFFNCPPRMSDGRHFTDFRPRCVMNTVQNNTNSYEHRQYLIHNAETLMNTMREQAYKENVCGPCVEPFKQGTMLPEQSTVECNANFCKVSNANPAGLGQGRSYNGAGYTSPQEQAFLAKREAENRRLMQANPNCCVPYSDDIQYYPLDGNVAEEFERFAVPGGGVPLTGTSRN